MSKIIISLAFAVALLMAVAQNYVIGQKDDLQHIPVSQEQVLKKLPLAIPGTQPDSVFVLHP